jgi:hypothetical protein
MHDSFGKESAGDHSRLTFRGTSLANGIPTRDPQDWAARSVHVMDTSEHVVDACGEGNGEGSEDVEMRMWVQLGRATKMDLELVDIVSHDELKQTIKILRKKKLVQLR